MQVILFELKHFGIIAANKIFDEKIYIDKEIQRKIPATYS